MVEHTSADEPRTLQTVEAAIEILERLMELEGAGVTEVATDLGKSKGGVYNHLATLRKHGYVYKEEEQYFPSYKFLQHGEYVRNRSKLYLEGKGEVYKLAERTGEYAHMMAEQNGRGIHLEKVKGEKAVGDEFYSKKRERPDYLHHGSTGKAILAHLSRERVEEIIAEHGLPSATESTITDTEELFAELEQIREQGFALNDEEEIRGLRAVGAPIRDSDGSVLGAISVSGPTSRIQGELFHETYPKQVMKRANVIELNIGYSDRRTEFE